MQETRDALLRAGIELFAKEGLDAPSLDAICARAGKTRGAFYVHFTDRDDFLAAVMERVGMPFLDAVLGVTEGDPSGPPSFDAAAARFVEAMASGTYPLTRGGALRPSQLIDACTRSRRVRDRYVALIDDAVKRVAALVRRGQAEGRFRADVDPDALAGIALATIVGAQTMLVDLRLPLPLPATATTFLRLLQPPG